jgi:hypothetical protein
LAGELYVDENGRPYVDDQGRVYVLGDGPPCPCCSSDSSSSSSEIPDFSQGWFLDWTDYFSSVNIGVRSGYNIFDCYENYKDFSFAFPLEIGLPQDSLFFYRPNLQQIEDALLNGGPGSWFMYGGCRVSSYVFGFLDFNRFPFGPQNGSVPGFFDYELAGLTPISLTFTSPRDILGTTNITQIVYKRYVEPFSSDIVRRPYDASCLSRTNQSSICGFRTDFVNRAQYRSPQIQGSWLPLQCSSDIDCQRDIFAINTYLAIINIKLLQDATTLELNNVASGNIQIVAATPAQSASGPVNNTCGSIFCHGTSPPSGHTTAAVDWTYEDLQVPLLETSQASLYFSTNDYEYQTLNNKVFCPFICTSTCSDLGVCCASCPDDVEPIECFCSGGRCRSSEVPGNNVNVTNTVNPNVGVLMIQGDPISCP